MTDRRLIVAFAGMAAAAALVTAGPLTPPSGPAGPTYRTLTEIEPRTPVNQATCPGDEDSVLRISQPGTYYLTGNVIGVSGKSGIEIAVSGVVLDLNGFVVRGATGSLHGIAAANGGVKISNGTVSLWGLNGITAGAFSDVRGVTAAGNAVGVELGAYSSISDSVARQNQSHGIRLYSIGFATNCTALGNGLGGTGHGFLIQNSGNTITGCRSASNKGDGFWSSAQNSFSGCVGSYNDGDGFEAMTCMLTDCIASDNDEQGFYLLTGSVGKRCNATGNGYNGFLLAEAAVAEDCTASYNGSAAHVNWDAGIYVGGVNCRVAGNHSAQNRRGIVVPSALNAFVAQNTAAGNTLAAFVVSAGNDTGAVLTNPGTGFNATNPFANVAP